MDTYEESAGLFGNFWRTLQGCVTVEKKKDFVMMAVTPVEAQDLFLEEEGARIEIRDAFNKNLVIQRYRKITKTTVFYIPADWEKKITLQITDGEVYCLLSRPCRNLELAVVHGTIRYAERT